MTMGPADRPERLILPSTVRPAADSMPLTDQPGTRPDTATASGRIARGTPWAEVPWRTIMATIGLVAAASLLALAVYIASRVVVWVVIAGFFAVVLARPVGWLVSRHRVPRGVAIAAVVLSVVAFVSGAMTLFVLPVRSQLVAVLTDVPGAVRQAGEGRGPVGQLVKKLHLEQLVRTHQQTLTKTAKSVQDSLPAVVGSAIRITLAVLTIAVMTCLMLSQSANLGRAGIQLLPSRHREWMSAVGRDAAKAISGYMIGNLLISLCAGGAAFMFLLIAGVPSALVIALWVAFADLIPLVGATLGAVVAVAAAFFVSTTTGIVAIVFFLAYQQFENSVLQIVIMSRTVRVNPLMVLLSVLLGVELFGVVGALLAVPVAGAAGVIAKELWRHRPEGPAGLIVVTDPGGAAVDSREPHRRSTRRRLKRLAGTIRG